MPRILACIDGSAYSESVADHAAWAAGRLSASVELLQVLGRREAGTPDLSGSIAPDEQRALLEELAALDAERAKLLQRRGRMVLEAARARLAGAGITAVTLSLRHGDLLDSLAEAEDTADLVVIGKRGEAADFATLHLGSNLERVIRASRRPVLVASRAWRPIRKALIAFDGGVSALKAVDHVSRSPLFVGLEIHLVTVGMETPAARHALESAAAQLRGGALDVAPRLVPGMADKAIAGIVEAETMDLLVMGAYGHSRIRSLVIGSTTTAMVRACRIPVLMFR